MEFCSKHGIKRNFSATRTKQHNGVAERKNMTFQEMARTMLKDSKLGDIFWPHVVHTTIHIHNIGMLRTRNDKTPYEVWKGRPTNVKNFRIFGSKFFIKREDGKLGKFDSRVYEGIFLGYSRKRKEYKCFKLIFDNVMESVNVTIDETGFQKNKDRSKSSKEQDDIEKLKIEEVEDEE
jgi:hypothetical protein